MSQSAQKAGEEFPLLYYDLRSREYWRERKGWFLPLGASDAKLHLRQAGCSAFPSNEDLNEVERALYVAQMERPVHYAGPLGGYRVGLYKLTNGFQVLVTTEARGDVFMVPKGKTEFPHLEAFLDELFGPEQLPHVLGWLKCALASLRSRDFRPGQLLVLAGPSSCGKSLFQALVTELLGGRSANPFDYLTGRTAFNEDLAQCEHWLMEEATGSSDIRVRLHFADSIKAATVGGIYRVHGKGKRALSLQTFRRMTLSINDEPESLMVLPPMNESILDKVILTKCAPASLSHDRAENWSRLASELPALAAWLHGWRLPRALVDPRFGVGAFHNVELLDVLSDISPERRLSQLVDAVIFKRHKKDDGPWQGSALELERELRQSAFAPTVDRLFSFSSACGVYLARLAKSQPDRYRRKCERKSDWSISAP